VPSTGSRSGDLALRLTIVAQVLCVVADESELRGVRKIDALAACRQIAICFIGRMTIGEVGAIAVS